MLGCANFTIPPEGGTTYLLRIAWLAMAANAGIFILRPLVETSLWNQITPGYSQGPVAGVLASHLDHSRELLLSCGGVCDVESVQRDWSRLQGSAS